MASRTSRTRKPRSDGMVQDVPQPQGEDQGTQESAKPAKTKVCVLFHYAIVIIYGRFATLSVCPWTFCPQSWTFRPLDDSPPRQFDSPRRYTTILNLKNQIESFFVMSVRDG